MEPELENKVEDNSLEEGKETTLENEVEIFAEDVVKKAKAVTSGDMTVADFVSQSMEGLGKIEVALPTPEPLGGLGIGGGEFKLPKAE